MKQINTPQKKWGCGTILVAILMICGAFYLFPRIFGGNDGTQVTEEVENDNSNSNSQNSSNNAVQLGDLEISENIDRDGCAEDSVSSLRNVDRFYVIAPNSELPEGTTIFARLYRDGQAIEDLPAITSNQDYDNSCVNFVFETNNGDNFESGDYEAEFFVNGNSYNSINFSIR